MKLDRALQHELLEKLAQAYPEMVDWQQAERTKHDAITINLYYLEEHDLVVNIKSECMGAPKMAIASTITARGLDFIADDGGLTAILGTVTVKLHADTLRSLIEARIAASDIPEPEKKRITDHLRELPSEALKTVTTRLVEAGLDNLPNAIPLLKALLGF